MSKASEIEKVIAKIRFWVFLRQNARSSALIDKCNKALSALYDQKFALLQWFLD